MVFYTKHSFYIYESLYNNVRILFFKNINVVHVAYYMDCRAINIFRQLADMNISIIATIDEEGQHHAQFLVRSSLSDTYLIYREALR